MQLARCNIMTLNVFGWASLEPEEGKFDFDWLDRVMDGLAGIGCSAVLATPSGAKPNWMAEKYPEIRRVDRKGLRAPQQGRHNHCYSSPIYRQKTAEMAERLAKRYKSHPALVLWHLNNELNGGECHCEYCHAGFRQWLQERYKTLDALNHAWWRAFWGGNYSSWEQIRPLDPEVQALEMDWRRFTTHIAIQYVRNEAEPLRQITPQIPITLNFMGAYPGLDYWKLAQEENIASWDNYPAWHQGDDGMEASATAFHHDLCRSFKPGKTFLMMESTPEGTNWMDIGKTKKPGMHIASSIQALAHGSDSVQYFQWRKGRGGFEKFHGAVVDHVGHEKTRVFGEVSELGALLQKLDSVVGKTVQAEVGLVCDWENRWAIELSKGPRNKDKNHDEDCKAHYHAFWKRGIAVDMLNLDSNFSKYKLLVAPMLHMLPEVVAKRIESFVQAGGTFVTTYMSATVDENGLCHLRGRPGGLRKVLGIWAEECDVLMDSDQQAIQAKPGNGLGLKGSYASRHYADILHLEGAKSLAGYASDWYAGSPALTVHHFGKGQAYYLASRPEARFLNDFYEGLAKKAGIHRALDAKIPEGVEVCERGQGKERLVFLINYNPSPRKLNLGKLKALDLLSGKKAGGVVTLKSRQCMVLAGS
jgi:beta-galactosidase